MGAMLPKISISLVTNRLDILFRRAINSIISQKMPPYEVIVVIDGYSWKHKEDPLLKGLPSEWNIYWTESESSGAAMPRNLGMYYATGDWILIFDGDDLLLPSCVETYNGILPHIHGDMVVEFPAHAILHSQVSISKNMPPDRNAWNDVVRSGSKALLSATWKRGDLPIRPLLLKNEVKKYYPLDYYYLEDKILIFHYMIEERRITVSDYPGYIRNIHPRSVTSQLGSWGLLQKDEIRFKRIASNVNINNWTLRDKVFDLWKSHKYLSDEDKKYIEDSISYFSNI